MFGAWLLSDDDMNASTDSHKATVNYAVFTSNVPRYREKLEGVMETWAAKPLSEDRFFAVGARDYKWPGKGIIQGDCDDNPQFLSCKEARIIQEGAKRETDWLVITGEDNYIDTARFDKFLSKYPKDDTPRAIGLVGCGGDEYCPNLSPHSGGFCGGAGYALNRAALLKMVAPGDEPMMHEYMDEFKGYPSDMATSCVVKKREIPMLRPEGGTLIGGGTVAKKQYELYVENGFLTLHYMAADAMRWLHKKMTKDEAGAKAMEKRVFDDHGCCLACTTAPGPEGKERQLHDCWNGQMGSI
jgi:hypothetical protein